MLRSECHYQPITSIQINNTNCNQTAVRFTILVLIHESYGYKRFIRRLASILEPYQFINIQADFN